MKVNSFIGEVRNCKMISVQRTNPNNVSVGINGKVYIISDGQAAVILGRLKNAMDVNEECILPEFGVTIGPEGASRLYEALRGELEGV